MVTIKDVSKKSGFSVTTVSKALNDYPDISSKTKKKILDLCDKMGYVPNLSARSLISKRSYTMGVIYEETSGVGLQHPLFSRILESFKYGVEKEGYDLLFLSKNIMKRKDSYLQHTKRKQVEGVLVLCTDFDSDEMKEMYQSSTPQVVIDFDNANTLTVTSNNYTGVDKAMDYLYHLGHRKIAHISGGKQTYVGGQRIEQYEKSIKKNNLKLKEEYIVEGPNFTRQEGYSAMEKLLALKDRPTAVFCSSDTLAIGAIKAIEHAGLKVPDDISIVGFDGIELGQLISPKLTTIKQDAHQMGIIAAKTIIEMINEGKKKHIGESMKIDCNLIIGGKHKSDMKNLIKHFDFQNQDALDTTYWTIATGSKWANNELQIYTDKKTNLLFENGLVIKATYENKKYYSARLHTKEKFSLKYGRLEITFKVPKGKGTWPAIWMMPVHNEYGRWPKSGEIDIMEHTANKLDEPFFCLHTEKYNHTGTEAYKKVKNIPGFSDEFNKIVLDWEEDKITYILNDEHIATYTRGMNGLDSTHKGWPFDQEFYLIINLAIGGTFGGKVDNKCFPQEFIIKDIKIFSKGVKDHG